jgi:hypothetical protein
MHLSNPVIRSHYRNGSVKQYVPDHLILRTEPSSNNVNDYRISKGVENLPALRTRMSEIATTTSTCNRISSRPSSTAGSSATLTRLTARAPPVTWCARTRPNLGGHAW